MDRGQTNEYPRSSRLCPDFNCDSSSFNSASTIVICAFVSHYPQLCAPQRTQIIIRFGCWFNHCHQLKSSVSPIGFAIFAPLLRNVITINGVQLSTPHYISNGIGWSLDATHSVHWHVMLLAFVLVSTSSSDALICYCYVNMRVRYTNTEIFVSSNNLISNTKAVIVCCNGRHHRRMAIYVSIICASCNI